MHIKFYIISSINNNNIMEFASKFLQFTLLGVIALLSCSHLTQSVGHDTSIGFCNDITWGRSAPLMTKVVHKQNNRLFRTVFGRKIELSLRFPEVIKILFVLLRCCRLQIIVLHFFSFQKIVVERGI